MKIAYKTEIKPTEEQKQKISQSIGVCRFLYNLYIVKNKELYEKYKNGEIPKEKSFMSAYDFDKYINHEVKTLEEYLWISSCGSKARKKAICDAEKAFKDFFSGKKEFPKFKKKRNSDVKAYFPKNNKTDWRIDRHKVNIPTMKWVRLKEKGYIPTNAKVLSGTVSKYAGRYYVSVLCEIPEVINDKPRTEGIGIDLGVKDFAIMSNGITKKNINKTAMVKKLEKKLKREQRRLSRKYENLKKKGESTKKNSSKQTLKVERLYQRLANIRTDYVNKTVSEVIKRNPSYITIEDLNVRGMMKNRHLSKAVAQQKFSEFREKLERKCEENQIELRVVSRWFPSSKLCHCCGCIKKDLKLSDRIYRCECGYVEDRDFNASLNLRDCQTYELAF